MTISQACALIQKVLQAWIDEVIMSDKGNASFRLQQPVTGKKSRMAPYHPAPGDET